MEGQWAHRELHEKSPSNSQKLGYNLLIRLDEKFDKFAQETNYRPKLSWIWTSANYFLIP